MAMISVMMPVCKVEKYIAAALHSLLPHVNIVVADDASTDSTAPIIRDYAERYPDRVKAIFDAQNVGVAAACFNRYVPDGRWLMGAATKRLKYVLKRMAG
ncbi:hypothetical protein DA83_18870 [Pseudomonas sp. 250J]|uniref:glycosyltransferase family 2 protein n=1 Tax=Pseudomonas TaxID=286 RepID=UPI00068346E2|nr:MULTISPECIES: glycosyltransferase [Pseudomonas]KNX79051.1 hypothetical protein DA83_18870 [Pseudomonas sp. 250J]MCU7279563.1 glycosyltransferase [Pseudomonas peradeniyensis]QZA53180.1 glycosyltransferase [Pseudomonas sp. 2hn]